jgi:TPR repeat protein
LLKALFYYEIAAEKNQREAAGQVGKFHFWSLGMSPSDRDLLKAHRYFLKGAPDGLDGCREKYRQALKVQTKSRVDRRNLGKGL